MRRKQQIITVAVVLALAALPVHAAAYMKLDGIKGNATAPGKDKWIEIGSMATSDKGGQGTTKAIAELCSARAPMPSVALEIDGQTHVLRNVSFSDCQNSGNETKFAFTYAGCTTHGTTAPDHHLGGGSLAAKPTRAPLPKSYDHIKGGGSLIGAGPAPVAVQVESLTLNGLGATIVLTKELTGTLILTAQQKLPSLTLELTTGQKWTFSDVVVASAKRSAGDRPMESLSINFAKVEGPSTGFQARR